MLPREAGLVAQVLRDRYAASTLHADQRVLDQVTADLARVFNEQFGTDRLEFMNACVPGAPSQAARDEAATLARIPLTQRSTREPRPLSFAESQAMFAGGSGI